jgi:outer membrane protein OmpA-like peptidoglycan-associated protein
MKNILNLAFVALCSFSLIGCSYFKAEEIALEPMSPSTEVYDITNPNVAIPAGNAAMTGAQSYGPPPTMGQVVDQSTNGNVEIFPLDGAALQTQPAATTDAPSFTFHDDGAIPVDTVAAIPISNPPPTVFSADPSVEVFPLDGPGSADLSSNMVADVGSMNIVNAATGDAAVIYFGRGSTRLGAQDIEKITAIAMMDKPVRGIAVQGYASTESSIGDPVERKIANLKVSMDRAFAVAKSLMEKGIPGEMIVTHGYGEERPGPTAEQSRRVEIRGL